MFKKGYSYDDVLMTPRESKIKSRSQVSLTVKLSKGISLENPFVPANMKTIMNEKVLDIMSQNGSLSIMHRFDDDDEQIRIAKWIVEKGYQNYAGMSVGVKNNDYSILDEFIKIGIKIICIDIAHGHSSMCLEMCKYISKNYPDIFLIAGNVATGEGARDLWLAGADAVKSGIGAGCWAGDTRILMSNGIYKNIKDVQIGDYVINKNGNPVKVINSFSTGIKRVVKVKNNSFYKSAYATPDHQMWIGDLNTSSLKTISVAGYKKLLDKKSKTKPKQSKYKWKSLQDLQQDVFLMPKNIKFDMPQNFSIPLNKRVGGSARWDKEGNKYAIDSVITASYESGYLFGTFLGNGHALSRATSNGSHIGNVSWTFGLHEMHIAKKLNSCIEKIFNKSANIELSKSKNVIEVYFFYKPLADYLSTFGKRKNKKIPNDLLVDNEDYLLGLYEGLVDSDGHCEQSTERVGFTNTSIYLIELWGILNYKLFNHFPISSEKKIAAGGLTMNIENCNQPYASRILQKPDYRLTDKYQVIKKMSIEDVEEHMEVFDLTVDCDTHSFIANNMIVHNSICLTRIETGNGSPQLTAIMDASEEKKKLQNSENFNREIFLIADGGLTNTGNCAKALAYADLVMAGNLFAATDESPGEIVELDGIRYKQYNGSSTLKENHVEGVKALKECKGPMQNVLDRMKQGVSSALSYQGVDNLIDFKEVVEFIEVSSIAQRENGAHDVRVI